MNPLCSSCGLEMTCAQSGAGVVELREDGSFYKLWHADYFRCARCGAGVVAGFAAQPFRGQWDEDWREQLDRAMATHWIVYWYPNQAMAEQKQNERREQRGF